MGARGSTVHYKHSSGTEVSVMPIALIGILAASLLLVSYYLFAIRCCVYWHRIDLLYGWRVGRAGVRSPASVRLPRGLDEAAMRSIPVFKFKKVASDGADGARGRWFCECAVCLDEFLDEERLRMLPNCCHVFHFDCIDVWLQNSANCPLCRAGVSGNTRLFPLEHITYPTMSPRLPTASARDEGFVVIEFGDRNGGIPAVADSAVGFSCKQVGSKFGSRGDECIDSRKQDDEFAVEPIRRSFSFGSSEDRMLLLAVRDVVHRRRDPKASGGGATVGGGCSLSRRHLFMSGSRSRGSRNSILSL